MGILRFIRCADCLFEAKSDEELRLHYEKMHMSEIETLKRNEDERTRKRRYKEIYR